MGKGVGKRQKVSQSAFKTEIRVNNTRPLGGNRFTSLRRLRHDYNSQYQAGTVKVQRNLSNGLQFIATGTVLYRDRQSNVVP